VPRGLAAARFKGWDIVLWRTDGHHWERHATANSIAARILRPLAPGDIVLLHDADHYSAPSSWRSTTAALGRLLSELRERGLTPASLSHPATDCEAAP